MKTLKISTLAMVAWLAAGAALAATDYTSPNTNAGSAMSGSANTGVNASGWNIPAFGSLDTDNNKMVSRREFTANGQLNSTLFNQIDANRDGNISQQELDAYKSAHNAGTSNTSGSTAGGAPTSNNP